MALVRGPIIVRSVEKIRNFTWNHTQMRTMVLVYKNLQNWVILDKGKCWCAYSSTMVRIWDMSKKDPKIHHHFARQEAEDMVAGSGLTC